MIYGDNMTSPTKTPPGEPVKEGDEKLPAKEWGESPLHEERFSTNCKTSKSDDDVNPIPITVIVGPTACGKTAKSIEMAKKQPSIIINADSLQLFHDLPILTARPTIAEQSGIPHELFGVLGPWEKPSVQKWVKWCADRIQNAAHNGFHPIIVGGTGFYVDALLNGLSMIPDISHETKLKANDIIKNTDDLYDFVTKMDPCVHYLKPNDKHRLERALHVFLESGRSITTFHNARKREIHVDADVHYVQMDRDVLYDRINHRFDIMIENGAITDVEILLKSGVSHDAPVMHAIGAREIAYYLQNEMSWDDMMEKAKQFSRNYAKRQMTWFNKKFKDI